MTRKTVKLKPETKERLDELKRDGETTDGLLSRAFDALEADVDSGQNPRAPRCTSCNAVAEVWTVEGGELVCGNCAEGPVEIVDHNP